MHRASFPCIDYPIVYINDPEDIFLTALDDKVTVDFSVDAWG